MRFVLVLVTLFSVIPAGSDAGPADPASNAAPAPGGSAAQAPGRPDFFFGRPRASVGIRGQWTFPRAGSDWFDFVTDELTLDRSDFRAAGVAGEVTIALARRVDLVLGADYASAETRSEFRDFVDDNRLPIEQSTRLRHAAFTGGVRFALTRRGREISSLAWVPHRLVPYVGGGAGVVYYRLEQQGDFVDFQDLSIFTDSLQSSGWAPAGYVNAGTDVHLFRRMYLTVDGRYLWAAPELTEPWRSFEALDLAGFRLSTGVNFVF